MSYAGITAAAWIFVAGSAWEARDFARVWVVKGDATEITLVNDADEVAHEQWVALRELVHVGLSAGGATTMQLKFGVSSDSVDETAFFDHFSISGVGQPPALLC